MPLGSPWPTIDPFLFCVHHNDSYPAANGDLGPAGSLANREIGSDFGGLDGWRMYHGDTVPGFPRHPHRGFETVTFVRRGLIDHADSLGASARYGEGDVQWLTAGGGVVHSEMFPLLDETGPNPAELFQIWVNFASADKLAEPYFTMLWAEDIPHHTEVDAMRKQIDITVIAGTLAGLTPPPPPPSSWAARSDSDLAMWHIVFDPGATWTMPSSRHPDTVRTVYLFEGDGASFDGELLDAATGAVVVSDHDVSVTSATTGDRIQLLVLQARPIGEPVAQYGPFVMNDRAGIEQAFADYQRTGFGGWPWPADGPAHGHDPGRFARRPDGTIERPGPTVVDRSIEYS
ncbi:MAG: pirin family protein [Ilumatobacteraceae bacterium]